MAKKNGFLSNFFEVAEKPLVEKIKEVVVDTLRISLTNTPVVTTSSTGVNSMLMSKNRYTGKFDSVLDSIIEKENLPGPDVYELIMSVKELMSSGISEDQAYRSAFTAFKSMGLTKEKLVETSHHYIGILSGVYQDFQTNVIGKKETEIANLDKRTIELNSEIERLTEEMRTVNTDRKALYEEVITIKQEMDGSYEKVDTFFKGVTNKVETYL